MKTKTQRRLLFLYMLILLAVAAFYLVYALLGAEQQAHWGDMNWIRLRWIRNLAVGPLAWAAMGAIPALYVQTGHLHRLTGRLRLLLMLACVGCAVFFLGYPMLHLTGWLKEEVYLWLWSRVVYWVAHQSGCSVLLGFMGSFGIRVWLDRKEAA